MRLISKWTRENLILVIFILQTPENIKQCKTLHWMTVFNKSLLI